MVTPDPKQVISEYIFRNPYSKNSSSHRLDSDELNLNIN